MQGLSVFGSININEPNDRETTECKGCQCLAQSTLMSQMTEKLLSARVVSVSLNQH